MAKQALPSLSSSGWIVGIAHKAEMLFAYFLTSERSQSNAYPEVASLPYLIQNNANKPEALANAVEAELRQLYGDYFDRVNVNVTYKPMGDDPNDPRLELRVDVRVFEDDKEYDLAQLVRSSSNVITRVVNLNRPDS